LEVGGSSDSTAASLEKFAESPEMFLDLHWAAPKTHLVISKIISEVLHLFHFYNRLEQAVVASRRQLTSFGKHVSENGVFDLYRIVGVYRQS
jgi:hypothetical protein